MKIVISIFLLFWFTSCSEKSKENSKDPLDYVSDTTIIAIDRDTEPITRTQQYLDGNLYWWNSDRETITVIDLQQKKVTKSIRLERDGPNGLGKPYGFFVHSSDSIYIPTMAYKFQLINSEGNLINSYDYFEETPRGQYVLGITRYSNMIFDHKDQLVFQLSTLRMLKPNELDDSSLQEYAPLLSFDIKSGLFHALPYRIPSTILDPVNELSFGLTLSNNDALLLHSQSNKLFQIDVNKSASQEIYLKTDLVKNFSNEYFLRDKNSFSIDDNMRVSYKSAENFGIAYDSFNELIYRFGWPGEEIPEDVDPMQYSATPPYFVISIYDGQDYSLLQEFTLPRNTYLAHHYFVDKNGLKLFPMHPENPEFNEDEMVIHTFDFSSLKK
jgi:hypothetical protein